MCNLPNAYNALMLLSMNATCVSGNLISWILEIICHYIQLDGICAEIDDKGKYLHRLGRVMRWTDRDQRV